MPTAITYCRTSTTGQKDAQTIGSQKKVVERLQKEYGASLLAYGPRKDGRLEDDGVSGHLLAGREFAQLIYDLEADKVKPTFLIVPSTSRLSRQDTFSDDKKVQIQSALDAARINVVLRVSGVKVIDEEGIHQDLRQAALEDSHERDKIRRRTMAGKHRWFGEGKYVRGGRPPYGYVRSGDTLKFNPDEAKHLKAILQWYLEGGVTYAARRATETNILTPMSETRDRKNKSKDWTPTKWNPVSVQHVVRNIDAYLGSQTLVYDGKPYVMKYPALIDVGLHARVVERRKTKTLKRRAMMLSTGFCVCACGAAIHVHNSHDRHRVACSRKCSTWPEPKFAAVLWASCLCRLIAIERHEKATNVRDFRPDLAVARAKEKEVRQQIQTTLDFCLNKSLNEDEWKVKNDVLNVELARAVQEVERLERERRQEGAKVKTEATVEAKVTDLLDELLRDEPDLDRKRQVVGELLGAEKVMLNWKARTLTWPAFGKMEPEVVSLDETTWEPTAGTVVSTALVGRGDVEERVVEAVKGLGGSVEGSGRGLRVRVPA